MKNRLFGGIESCLKSIKKNGAVFTNTAPFFLIDFRRFEPAQKSIIQSRTVYLWKSKYANMTVPEAKRLRTLEEENSRLKRIVADQQLDIVALKDVLSKKW